MFTSQNINWSFFITKYIWLLLIIYTTFRKGDNEKVKFGDEKMFARTSFCRRLVKFYEKYDTSQKILTCYVILDTLKLRETRLNDGGVDACSWPAQNIVKRNRTK